MFKPWPRRPKHILKHYAIIFLMFLRLGRGVPIYISKYLQGISMCLRLGLGVPSHNFKYVALSLMF